MGVCRDVAAAVRPECAARSLWALNTFLLAPVQLPFQAGFARLTRLKDTVGRAQEPLHILAGGIPSPAKDRLLAVQAEEVHSFHQQGGAAACETWDIRAAAGLAADM